MAAIQVVSYRRPGPLTPRRAGRLRAGAVRLTPGASMDWHSTRSREELLVLLAGRVELEVEGSRHRVRRMALRPGRCAWIAPRTVHRVINRTRAIARYLYITA